jgi:outer membrane protein OmpA-like peptidoglycan-associated protein
VSPADGDRSIEALIVAASRLAAAKPKKSARKRRVAIAAGAAIALAAVGYLVFGSNDGDQPPAGAKVPLPGLVDSTEPTLPKAELSTSTTQSVVVVETIGQTTPVSEPTPLDPSDPSGSGDPSGSAITALVAPTPEPSTTLPAPAPDPSSTPDPSATPTNYAVYKDGVLYLTGSIVSAEAAAEVRLKAQAVLPPERIQGELIVDPTADGPSGIVRAESGVLFASNSSRIQPNFYADLDLVVAVLTLTPEASVEIHGYTDSVGSDESNLQLATARVAAITDYLQQQGIAADRVIGVPHGEADPVADNATSEGRAMNRRIDAIFRNLFG